jgi:hypothetical protein
MTTETKKTLSIKAEILRLKDGNTARSIMLGGKRYIYMSDLVDTYGSSFVKHLQMPPKLERINDGVTNQNRKLVTVADFRNALSSLSAPKKKSVEPVKQKYVAEQYTFDFAKDKEGELPSTKTSFTQVVVKPADKRPTLIGITITASEVNKPMSAVPTAEETEKDKARMLRAQIKGLIENFAVRRAAAINDESEDAISKIRKDQYIALYTEFERILSPKLESKGYKLEDFGLGKARFRKDKDQRMFDLVEAVNALPQLLIVAKEMFSLKK